MSYFGRDFAAQFAADERCSLESIETDVEVADGVMVERRSLFWLSAGAVTTLLAGAAPARAQDPKASAVAPTTDKLSFRRFLEQAYPLARRVVDSNGEDEEAYLMTLAALLSRLRDPAEPLRETMRAFRKEHRGSEKRFPLAAMTLRLQPGRGFKHHDHLDYNGVIMGVEGEVRIRNYDFQGTPPAIDSTDTFRIRETRDDLILPGRFSTLGRNRENIHDLVAGKQGARVLDVFTFFEKGATSRYLEVDEKPRDAEARIYDAAWRPRRRR